MPTVPFLGGYGDLSGSGLMFRNKIINGSFDIWQRATSQTSSDIGSADRWYNESNGSTKTTSRQAFPLGQTDVPGNPKYFMRTVVSSVAGASNYALTAQRIEGVQTLAGQVCTLSFYAKADATKNIAVDWVQYFGAGGSPSAAITGINTTTFTLTTSWQRFTMTFTMPSISGKVLGTDGEDRINPTFWFDAGSSYNARTNSLGNQSGTFDIANVQFEAGNQATPFEQRPLQTELDLCQRYAGIYAGSIDSYICPALGYSASTVVALFPFPTNLRIKPRAVFVTGTITANLGGTSVSCGSATLGSAVTPSLGFISFAASGVPVGYAGYIYSTGAYKIIFDSELT